MSDADNDRIADLVAAAQREAEYATFQADVRRRLSVIEVFMPDTTSKLATLLERDAIAAALHARSEAAGAKRLSRLQNVGLVIGGLASVTGIVLTVSQALHIAL